MNRGHRLFKDAGAIAAFSVLTAVTGLLVDVLLASRFGLGGHTDAFYAAYTIPFLFSYIAFSVGQSTLVPIFSRYLAKDTGEDLWSFFSTFINIALVLSVFVTLAGFALAPAIASLVAPGLDAETAALAAGLCRLLFLIVGLSALAEVFRAFLYADGAFVLASSSNFIRNSAAAASIFLLAGHMGIRSAAYGYVAGYGLQALLLGARVVSRYRPRYRLVIDRNAWGLRESGKIGAAQVAGFLMLQAVTLAERMIGSFLPAGSITALSYASRITFMAVETFSGSIATSILPSMSRAVAGGERAETARLFDRSFRFSLLVFLPMTAFVVVLKTPLIELLYQRGSFTAGATALTASVFMLYSLSLVFQGFNRLIHNYLFAEMNPRGSLTLFITLAAVTVTFDLLLVRPFGIAALPLGYLIGSGAAFLMGYGLFVSKLGLPKGGEPAAFAGKVLLLSLIFGGILYKVNGLLGLADGWGRLLNLSFTAVAAAAVALVAARILKLKEIAWLGILFGRKSS
ncbi:MAG TPA: lipid II flippase MurJ [Nitrospirota bacterium]|nr:lipid II flippase MurJ [Nitrospirota bacterium]